jgi:hypothetical protein
MLRLRDQDQDRINRRSTTRPAKAGKDDGTGQKNDPDRKQGKE